VTKILIVAWREFIETVRTKMFIVSTIFMPTLILGGVYATESLAKIGQSDALPVRKLAVVDPSQAGFEAFAAAMAEYNAQFPQRPFEADLVNSSGDRTELAEQVRRGLLYAFIVFPPDPAALDASVTIGRKDNSPSAGAKLQEFVQRAVLAARCRKAAPPLEPAFVEQLNARPRVNEIDVQTGVESSGGRVAQLVTPFVFMFMLFMGTFGISSGLLTSVIEEKSSRIMEVLLSAVSPTQLMSGKILGMVLVGVLMLTVWGTVGYTTAQAKQMSYLVTGLRLFYAVLYFIPGFLLMSSLLAAIGSACNDLKEAQSLSFPISAVTIVPMILWFQITEQPNSALAVTLSFVPLITPFIMILRVCADPSIAIWQIVATLAVLWASVFATMWAAGKIFRIGVLMYGKAPSFRELARWLRYA
jgi:ABC-2 type transport system permease protein